MKEAKTSETEALETLAMLSSAYIWPELYFPVREPLSNEAKQCDSYFSERWSFYIVYETAICCHNPHKSSNWDPRITWQLGYKHTCCQNVVPTNEKCLSLHFPKNITCLNVGLLRIGQVSSVFCNTVWRWVTISCCFMSDWYLSTKSTLYRGTTRPTSRCSRTELIVSLEPNLLLAAGSQSPSEGWKATYMFNFHVRIINSGWGLISTPVLSVIQRITECFFFMNPDKIIILRVS